MYSHEWNYLDAITDRLLHSENELEKRSLYQGLHYHHGYPVFLDTNLLLEHKHIIGPTGSGKTSMGLQTDVLQLIRQNDGAVVIFDCKGDPALFHSVYAEAQRNGRTFKWFTNKPHRSTYVFNPWDNRALTRLSLPDILGLFMQSLNLHHGEDYGRAWFQMLARTLLRRGVVETLPEGAACFTPYPRKKSPFRPELRSFRDLCAVLDAVTNDNEELRGARHLAFIAESLADFEQLNLSPNRNPNHAALDHAIFMPEVIREKQVIYFYLVGAMDVAAVSEIAKLALYSLFTAAMAYYDEHGRPPRVYTAQDEVQVMIGRNIENVLAQFRSYGIGCILAHQSMSQLNPPGGADLRELVMMCTAVKMIFGARDPWTMEYISRTSGTTRYYKQNYTVSANDALRGRVGVPFVSPDRDGNCNVAVAEYTGPRIANQDILDISHDPNVALMWLTRPSGLSTFRGWFPVRLSWPVSEREHSVYGRASWPEQTDATIEMKSIWPEQTEYTLVPKRHPPVAETPFEFDASAKLKMLWKDMEDK